jgi:hypothetical protein
MYKSKDYGTRVCNSECVHGLPQSSTAHYRSYVRSLSLHFCKRLFPEKEFQQLTRRKKDMPKHNLWKSNHEDDTTMQMDAC